LFGLAFGTVMIAALAGCGGGDKAEVSGKVTLGDKPVAGFVTFITADGKEFTAPTDAEGKYLLVDVPIGPVKVGVKGAPGGAGGLVAPPTPKGAPEMPKEMTAGVGSGVPPPAKYAAPASSGLAYEVKAGKQTFDIPLK